MVFAFPPPLRPGSLVAVVAPASPVDRNELFRGLAWLRTRYRLRIQGGLLTRTGYTAGTDARRKQELEAAMLDPEVEAILCARGGYGALRIVDALPWDAFCAAPKWIVGFSDVTALHVAANARGIATVHAANASGWGRSTPTVTAERHELLAALEAFARSPWTHLERLHSGPVARGPLVGGNLSLLAAMAAANQLRIPPSAILAFEDVTERPYRLDRILMSLRLGGYFENVAALVLGSFTACDAGPDEVTARQVFEGLTADLGIAVVAGAPFGHGPRNAPFVTGGVATLLGTTLTFA